MAGSKKQNLKFTKIEKRDGRIVPFDLAMITRAIKKALVATDQGDGQKAKDLSQEVLKLLSRRFRKNEIPKVEQIQDIVEEVLIAKGYAETAKAYILYREQRRIIREGKTTLDKAVGLIDKYIEKEDWRVKENSNMGFSIQGLHHYITSNVAKRYWLNKIYPKEIRQAALSGDFHIHDLDFLGAYCCGWDLQDLLLRGFGGVSGKVECSPPKHLRSALGQMVNFFYTLQGESAGAQAFSDFDALLAPFIRYDNLDYRQVKQAMQEFIYNCAIPTRVGFQTPFTNITLDLKPPQYLKDQPVIIGGKLQKETYGEFQEEMNMINRAFCEVMTEGDAKGRVFTFPIPTINITKDFDWDNPNYQPIWEMTAKYGIPYFCLDESTEIFTDKGVKKIKDISLRDRVLSPDDGYVKIKFKKRINSNESILIEGDNFSIVSSRNHRFPVATGIKKAADLSIDDQLLQLKEEIILENGLSLNNYYQQFFKIDSLESLQKEKFIKLVPKQKNIDLPKFQYNKNRFQTTLNEKVKIPRKCNQTFMELIGIILGDGSIGRNRLRIVNADIEIIEFVKKSLVGLFKLIPHTERAGHSKICQEISVNSALLVSFLEKIGVRGNTYTKRIPELCFWQSEKEIGSLLRGLFDTDGSVILNRGKNHIVSISFSNESLMQDVLALLLKVGIVGKISGKKRRRITITGERNINLFRQKVNFRISRKRKLLMYPCKDTKHPSMGDKIISLEEAKNIGQFYKYKDGRDGLVRIKNNNQYPYLFISSYKKTTIPVSLKRISLLHEKRVLYDITVDSKHHLFVLKNGIISHNSNYINSDMSPDDTRSMCLYPTEELLIRRQGKIQREAIGKVVKQYKLSDFDKDGWADCDPEHKLEALSLNYSTGKVEWAKVNRFLKIKDKKLTVITTEEGKEIKTSTKHLVPVLTSNGLTNKFAEDIKEGDYLLAIKKAPVLANNYQNIAEGLTLDEDLAKILGYFTADGNYLFETRKNLKTFGLPRGLQFTFNAQTKENVNDIKRLLKKVLGLSPKERKDPRYNSYYLYVYNTKVSRALFKAGFKKYGRLPNIIFNSPASVIESFLSYHFKGDGYRKRGEIHINDEKLSRDLTILYSLIGRTVTYKKDKNSQNIYIQHQKNEIREDGLLTSPIISQRVPGFLARSTYLVPGLVKSRMVGIATLEKYQAHTELSLKIKDSDFYIVRVKNTETRQLKSSQTFFDLELEKNHLFVHSLGAITHNCCRLRLDNRELRKRGGGLFGSNPLTGSIGVVTINLPRIGYLSKTKKEFFQRLEKLMDLAKESLEIKRKAINNFSEKGLYPYSVYYLNGVKKIRGSYWGNHFSTIGLIGANEALLNFIGQDISTPDGLKLAEEIMDYMRDRLVKYQEETDNLYNLEATPAEGTAYSLARLDKKKYPDIITAGTPEDPYYTNSTQLPVNCTDDLFEALELQDPLQSRYTGGTVFHAFLGERISDWRIVPALIRKAFSKFTLPYFSLTPTFSICPVHGYLPGEHFTCPKCVVPTKCEVYSRVVGYLRPVQQWNEGKSQEFKERKTFKINQ